MSVSDSIVNSDPDVVPRLREELQRTRSEYASLQRKVEFQALLVGPAQSARIAGAIDDVLWLWSLDGTELLCVNPAYEQLWQRSIIDLRRDLRSWMDAVHVDDRRAVEEALRFAVSNGAHEFEYRVLRPDGTLRWVRDRAYVVPENKVDPPALLRMSEDVTIRKLSEAASEQQDERFRLARKAAGIGIWSWDLVGNKLAWSEECFRMAGFDPSSPEPDYETWLGRTHPDDRAHIREEVRKLHRGIDPLMQYRTIHLDGTQCWIISHGKAFRDENGMLVAVSGIDYDITALKETEQALARSEELLRLAQLAAKIVSWDLSLLTKRITWSESFHDLFGTDPSQEKADFNTWLAMVHPEDRQEIVRRVENAVEGVHQFQFLRNGEVRWMERTGKILEFQGGQASRMSGIVQDISERKIQEEKIAALNRDLSRRVREFETLLDVIPIGISVGEDATGENIRVNTAFSKILGTAPGENVSLASSPPAFRLTRAGRDIPFDELPMPQAARNGKDVRNIELDVVHSDGRVVNIFGNAAPLFDEQGRSRGSIGGFLDITERKHVEQSLKFLEEAGQILNTSRNPQTTLSNVAGLVARSIADFCFCDLAENSIFRSTIWSSCHSLSAGDTERLDAATERGVASEWNPASLALAQAQTVFIPVLDQNWWSRARAESARFRLLSEMGMHSLISVPMVANGPVLGVLTITRSRFHPEPFSQQDVLLMEELGRRAGIALDHAQLFLRSTEANEHLRRANEDLKQFAFAASHDLQEPLRMVTAYTQLLMRRFGSQIDPDAKTFAKYIVDSADHLGALLKDLREYITLTEHEPQPSEPVDLNAVLQRVLANIAGVLEDTGGTVTSDSLPKVLGRQVHFIQLLQNLIANGLKYRSTVPPHVHVSARAIENGWEFSVRDNGIGIDPVYLKRIFGVFKRLHGKDVPGTGIGLAICSKVVDRYGGRIWAESEPGSGSVFYFTIPNPDATAPGGLSQY